MSEYRYSSAGRGHHASYLLEPLLNLIGAEPLKVADLGCGNGSLSHAIATRGHEVTGLDSSVSAIDQARQAYPSCRFFRASIDDLPSEIELASFDLVVSLETIEHLIDPRALLRATRRLLHPGGRLILSTPYHGYLKNLALAATGKMDDHFTALWDGGHVKFFSVRTLTALVQSEGFSEIEFRFAGRVPWLWKSMICSARLP